jgi:hypothetical protein
MRKTIDLLMQTPNLISKISDGGPLSAELGSTFGTGLHRTYLPLDRTTFGVSSFA